MGPNTKLERRAAAFRHTRDQRAREVGEDYVEMIGDLIAEFGEARLTDLAAHMGVAAPTAAKVVARLQTEGLVQNRPYRSLFLTVEGEALAKASRDRHALVKTFLLALGVDEHTAERDSEGMEHHVGDETLAAMQRFLAGR
jgi:DtxR family manganese transport transcriptional regulator